MTPKFQTVLVVGAGQMGGGIAQVVAASGRRVLLHDAYPGAVGRALEGDLDRGLVASGIAPGDRVALLSRTRYEWTLFDYAIVAAGAVTVPIYETSSAEQAEWILSDSAAKAVIAETEGFEKMITDARDRLPALEHLWRMDPGLSELTAGGAGVTEDALAERTSARNAADIATIIYTSGTTGRPKGCELTHENLLADVRNTASQRVAEKAGFVREGVARAVRAEPRGTARVDMVVFAHVP